MRDYRDAKAMAHTLREALNAKSISLTHSECLELVAKTLGFHDWHVLSAKIQSEGKLPAAEPDRATQTQDKLDPSGKPVREEVAVDAAILDSYVGFYQLHEDAVFTVTRDGHHLVTQLTGQQTVPIYPESNTAFFAKVVDAQISFITDAKGQATTLVLHQNGTDHQMPRIDAATAREVERRVAEKVKSQAANPGTEAALHRLIAGLTSGKPNDHDMTPALAEATHRHLDILHRSHESLGAVQSVTFLGVGQQGEDVYTVKHDNGASHWRIALDSKGLISTAWVTPGP
jgi:hypothetical protein